MNYSAISLQGNILSSEIVEKVRSEDIRFQKPEDFLLKKGSSLRDEISLAWSLAQSHWTGFRQRSEKMGSSESGTLETRRYWLVPLLGILGYEVSGANADIVNGKSYAISHRAHNLAQLPLHLVGIHLSLDKRADSGGTRLSPHSLVQEYINNTEHLYGLVSNGRHLRLLRDATRLSRLSYLEFDLEQMMEQGLYAEFALLFRLLHASRLPANPEVAKDSILEFYHQEALASGSRIRERLSQAVEKSIKLLANGLLKHPANEDLRHALQSGRMTPADYYLRTLRLVYRMLFLMVTEERRLIYPEKTDEAMARKRDIYYRYYSLQRLARLASRQVYIDPRKSDLWQALLATFALFEREEKGRHLGIAPLGSGIFAPDALGILSAQMLDNESLLTVLRWLVTFENAQGQRVRVNYADLDVEEFGSVYEGLLEYDPEITDAGGQPEFGFVKGDGRSSSGSHYTPEELVQPLIKHSLDYLIADKLKEAEPEKGLLSLSICDVACGSGHILLSAARRVGFELAKVRSKEDQPTPPVLRVAVRDVIRNCIYGVDLNPLAVELCKVALWLEAHEPGEPLNFLDHHIKCGNAIVGLAHAEELEKGIASEAFKTLPGDDKEVAAAFKKRNDQEIKTSGQLSTFDVEKVDDELKDVQGEFLRFSQLPESTPEQIARKEKAYQDLTKGKKWWRLKQLADLQVAQFFIPKTMANKDSLTTHSQYITYLKQGTQILDRGAALAISEEMHFFHWFLEFPEVFQRGGFDCILGNPPFLGGQKLSGSFGDAFLESIKYQFAPIGAVDLVTYFFRRIFSIIKPKGFQSLISTNTIAQGKSREDGLDVIVNQGGSINHAVKSTKWPGVAAVEVALVTITKQVWKGKFYLGGKEAKTITPYLDDSETIGNPYPLKKNEGKSFQGSIVLGKGFVLEPNEAESLIEKDSRNKDVLFPYLNGEDLNNNPDQIPSRWVINFFHRTEEKAKSYPDCYEIVNRLVKPDRIKMKGDRGAEYWWQFLRIRSELYRRIEHLDRVLVVARISKTVAFELIHKRQVFADALVVFPFSKFWHLAIMQSTIHNKWAWMYCTTMKADLNYSPGQTFETFPFPSCGEQQKQHLETIGEAYHEHRRQLMLGMQLGLTKTYNLFHSNAITAQAVNEKDKQVAGLQKHLEKTPNTISFKEAIQGILQLRELHVQMDEAVLGAYGWRFDSAQRPDIQLRHDFYEVDYLPENDRIRYTIHPEARKEVLKRLLELNHKIYAEEVAAGLWEKKGGAAKKKVQPEKTSIEYGEVISETSQAKEPERAYPAKEAREGSILTLLSHDQKEIRVSLGKSNANVMSISPDSPFGKALLGRKTGEYVAFGKGFKIERVE